MSERNRRFLSPANKVIFVSKEGITECAPESVRIDEVGEKTFGLACIPAAWTLPFVAVSNKLSAEYLAHKNREEQICDEWAEIIQRAASAAGILSNAQIMVRSSSTREGLVERGKFYSATGTLDALSMPLMDCLRRITDDRSLLNASIPLVIQTRCYPEKSRGHLSNERRCYEESRDWIGEIEAGESAPSNFNINLRHWRQRTTTNETDSLRCELSSHVSEVLRRVAEWTIQRKARLHFEWVWDGTNIYLVQADEEWSWSGHNPVEEHESRAYEAASFKPRCLQPVTLENGARFGKVANALLYLRLGMQTAPLYLLHDPKIISELVSGSPPVALREDISILVRNSLVIRTDLATADLHEKQLLPRTPEVRDTEVALNWLIDTSRRLQESKSDFAFIFHNFIPALAAAFAYARPGERRVQIESLWGLPEGLYYNSHDKHVVDTVESNAGKLAFEKAGRFVIRSKPNYKRFFVSTTPSGNWETLTVAPPFDWRLSLSQEDCRRIAFESRRIAETEQHALSIMWFVGVPAALTPSGVTCIPWYHEPFDIAKAISTISTRKKTTYDRSFTVSTEEDVETLRNHTSKTRLTRIRIQPRDESLLRKKETLQTIGLLAKEQGSIIVLEGGVLSHAYYQLSSTGAVVEVVHPFIGFDERQEYNKLVRDRVPELIVERGENVTVAQLSGDSHINALREKLIEEAFELVDARDLQSIVGEIADVQEILDCLKERLDISPERASEEQTIKRQERGSFSKGIVLVETEHTLPTSASSQLDQPALFALDPENKAIKLVAESEFQKRKAVVDKSRDRRTEGGKIEIRATFSVPVTRGEFVETTVEQPISATDVRMVSGELKAKRHGSKIEFELSVTVEERQLELFSSYSGREF